MPDRFSLPCPNCAASNAVETQQAGETISCAQCHQAIEVPTLRGLRLLSPVANSSAARRPPSNAGQFLVSRMTFALGLVLLLLGAVVGGALWYSTSQLETEPSQAEIDQLNSEIFASIDRSNVTEFWTTWHDQIIALPPGTYRLSKFAENRQIARTRRLVGLWFFGLVPLGVAAMIGSAFIRK
jgi:hypothetical protein